MFFLPTNGFFLALAFACYELACYGSWSPWLLSLVPISSRIALCVDLGLLLELVSWPLLSLSFFIYLPPDFTGMFFSGVKLFLNEFFCPFE